MDSVANNVIESIKITPINILAHEVFYFAISAAFFSLISGVVVCAIEELFLRKILSISIVKSWIKNRITLVDVWEIQKHMRDKKDNIEITKDKFLNLIFERMKRIKYSVFSLPQKQLFGSLSSICHTDLEYQASSKNSDSCYSERSLSGLTFLMYKIGSSLLDRDKTINNAENLQEPLFIERAFDDLQSFFATRYTWIIYVISFITVAIIYLVLGVSAEYSLYSDIMIYQNKKATLSFLMIFVAAAFFAPLVRGVINHIKTRLY